MSVSERRPDMHERVEKLLSEMQIKERLFDESCNLFYGGLSPEEGPSAWHYDIAGTEALMAAQLGVDRFGIPPEHLAKLVQADEPVSRRLKSWGGSMFEVMMPQLFLRSPASSRWGVQVKAYVDAQIMYGQHEDQGLWGYSPCNDPTGRYREFGVPELAQGPGYGTDHVVTPHAIALALPFAKDRACEALLDILEHYEGAYLPGFGFMDSVNTSTKEVAHTQLALDQSMLLISLIDYLQGSSSVENAAHDRPQELSGYAA